MRVRAAGAGRRALSMTPLIDVVFILLLFFMVASSFSTFGEVEIGIAGGGAPGGVGNTERLFVSIAPDGGVAVNGQPTDLDDLGEVLSSTASNEEAIIVVRADAAASSDDVIQTIDRARRAGLAGIVFAH